MEDYLNADDDTMDERNPDTMVGLEDGDGKEAFEVKVSRSMCNINMGNRDLSATVNGFSGDLKHLRPLDFCFTNVNIKNMWIKVGFFPMAYNALINPKVRYEVGGGGAPKKVAHRLELLVEDYKESSQTLV